MNLSSELLEKIGATLGRNITPSEEGSAGSFADLTESDINDIRLLEKTSGVLAISYIRFKLKGTVSLNAAVSYFATVIQQGVRVEDWVNEYR